MRAAVVAFLAAGAVAWLTRHVTRFEVAGHSMSPTLRHGEYVLATRLNRGGSLRVGHIVLARDPRETRRVVVKRVGALGPSGVWLRGDNPAASTDSRQFGPVHPSLVIARVRAVYWPPTSARLVR